MKKITTLFFILITMPFYAQWIEQNSGVTEGLNDVYCITESIVVVVGETGTILKTIDGGANWVQKNSGTTSYLNKVEFASADIGYITGTLPEGGAILLKTIDGGESWSPIDLGNSTWTYDISCIDENIFYITCDDGIKKTIDGGASFETVNTDQYGEDIQFITELVGFTGDYQVKKTTDGGMTWSNISSDNVFSYYFLNEDVGFINTTNGLYKTTDGGENYTYLQSFACTLFGLFPTSENVIWGIPVECLLNGDPCYSIRGEITETQGFQYSEGPVMKSIHFANPTTGYGVYWFGGIVKNSTGTLLDVSNFDLHNNIKIYPNPASETVTISFDEIQIQPFTINISDCSGKTIFTESHQAKSQIDFNVDNLEMGIYFLTVVSDDKRVTQKLIVR